MKLLERHVKINVISFIALLVIIISVVIIVTVIYSYGENECLSNPVDFANNNSYDYWWDTVMPIRYDLAVLE